MPVFFTASSVQYFLLEKPHFCTAQNIVSQIDCGNEYTAANDLCDQYKNVRLVAQFYEQAPLLRLGAAIEQQLFSTDESEINVAW